MFISPRRPSCTVLVMLPLVLLAGTAAGQHRRDVIQDQIGFAVYDYSRPDETNKIPIIYFHGTSTSRSEPELLLEQIRAKQRLVIAFDRPGYHQTAAFPFHSLEDYDRWAEARLLPAIHEVLGFEPEQFDLVSVSGGALYALRLAQAMPQKVRKLSLLSAGLFARPPGGEGRYERSRRLAANRPRVAEMIVKVTRRNVGLAQITAAIRFSPPDRQFAECNKELATRLYCEATRCGAAGIVQDARLQLCETSYARPVPEPVQCEIWNGACDYTVSLASAQLLSRRTGIPLNIIANEGHVSSLPISFANSVLPAGE